ncbi:hypothetical protein [Enterovirga rhinocerotis]|uniref:Uncharacterized protein n=1 Tax=Enterovirga rhinocerotis TaxID=1339210 RepID=A0A4R7BTY4_9HYPH|nr:hypothetical protein [Enterovirga rhinocerotis]TDR89200.1 hypothetical protein EV668_3689 [Enterovirga rhinocerotis]
MNRSPGISDGNRPFGSAFAFSASAGFGAVLVNGLARAAGTETFIVVPRPGQAAALLVLIVLAALAIGFLERMGPAFDAPLVRMLRRLRAGFYRHFRRGRSSADVRNAFAGAAIALVALCGVAVFVAATTFGILSWVASLALVLAVYVNLRLCLLLCRLARFDPVWCAILGLIYGIVVLSRFL